MIELSYAKTKLVDGKNNANYIIPPGYIAREKE
jgi:hypothetical protein